LEPAAEPVFVAKGDRDQLVVGTEGGARDLGAGEDCICSRPVRGAPGLDGAMVIAGEEKPAIVTETDGGKWPSEAESKFRAPVEHPSNVYGSVPVLGGEQSTVRTK
jgi:hypothetical protein